VSDSSTLRTIQGVSQSGAADWGQTIQLDLEFDDGQRETFRVPFERAPRLVHAIVQASAIAEQQRNLQSGGMVDIVSAYIVQDCQALTSNDHSTIGIQFRTGSGFPIQVAMSREVTANLAEQLARELARRHTRSPWKPS
jgi:hypothetical protein